MALDETKLFYHGPVEGMKKALELAKSFPAVIHNENNDEIYLDIELSVANWLKVYPHKSHQIHEIRPTKSGLEYLSCTAKSVGFSTEKGQGFQVFYEPKEGGF